MYKHFFKRLFDFCIALVALIIISPILLVITVWLHFANKGAGAFFTQERPGKDGRIFKVIKFKTMTDERDAEGRLLTDEQRLTKVGRFVRSTSIDELPQLINVLKGDMALIGPRPLLPQDLPLYSPEQARRHEVRPGISGWAQCHGRNAISWTEKFKLDVWYVDHCTLWTDLRVIFITIKNVLMRKDINSATAATMQAKELFPIHGSCIYGCQWKDKYVLSSTVEGDGRNTSRWEFYFGRKRGAGIKDDYVHMYMGNLQEGFKEIYKEKKDCMPYYTFQFGVFKFPAGVNNTDTLWFQPVATMKNDLRMVGILEEIKKENENERRPRIEQIKRIAKGYVKRDDNDERLTKTKRELKR